ncbi:MAG: hypothetical protein QOE25_1110 [Actinomycetota bacterium]|jgi:hypothetical protein|nr:hypothetical protein [Actinomycetota bacterium]
MKLWPWGMRRHEADFRALSVLASLSETIDPAEASRLVAEAWITNLPVGHQLADRYGRDPVGSFPVKEARRGSVEGVEATLVWTDPNVSPNMTGGVTSSSGPASGATFAIAKLPRPVPRAAVHSLFRGVPPGSGDATGHEAFDSRYLVGGLDTPRTFPAPVADVFVAAPKRPFGFASLWDDYVCAHSPDPPGSGAEGDRLIEFVVAVSRAYG